MINADRPARQRPTIEAVLDAYGPQLGEMIWHSLHYDPKIAEVVATQASIMRRLIDAYGLSSRERAPRILEVGAYSHWTVHQVAAEYGGTGVSHDIAPSALREGARLGREHGVERIGPMVASDFHDLPYSDGYFDFVFIASAVHHTFRPWVVIGELLRVLRPGGILYVANEPVARRFCLYQFRANRAESYTPFEAALQKAGLMCTVSSPFPGSRPETLFGMIENDRITLDIYLDSFARGGELLDLSLGQFYLLAEFEEQVLALPRGPGLETKLHALLAERVAQAAPAFGERDRALGFSVPNRDALWTLSYDTAAALRALPASDSPQYVRAITRLLGGSLAATVRKLPAEGGSEASPRREASRVVQAVTKLFRAPPAAEEKPMLRKRLVEVDGVLLDAATPDTFRLDISASLFPAINAESRAQLADVFPPDAWTLTEEAYGTTLVLTGSAGSIRLPQPMPQALILVRYYAICPGAPYRIRFQVDGAEAACLTVAQTESQLARFFVPADARLLEVRCANERDEPLLDGSLVRMNVVLGFPFISAGPAA